MINIRQALAKGKQILAEANIQNPNLDTSIILRQAIYLGHNQGDIDKNEINNLIFFRQETLLNEDQQQIFFDLIQRRKDREPISHLFNFREFYGREFFVNDKVLDPRPDSETLIESVLKYYKTSQNSLEILEIGVGSGCLIITILKEISVSRGTAVDLSLEALEICKQNVEKHLECGSSRMEFIHSNMFEYLPRDKKFDLIISNPPYISSKDIEDLEPEVRVFEPRMALDGGKDGLDFYRIIAKQASDFLENGGKIFLEIGFGQAKEVIEIFREFRFVECCQDLGNVERVLVFERV